MLKKILYLLSFVVISSAAVRAQSVVLSMDTAYADTALVSNQGLVSTVVSITNTSTTDTLQMKWKVLLNTIPHTWGISYCDPSNCYTSAIFNTGARYPLIPGQVGIMKLDLTPNCIADSPTFRILTWAISDSANTAHTTTWKMAVSTANCSSTTAVTDITTSQISLYPNPARNEVRVNLPSNVETAQVEIFSLIGSKVYSQSVNKGKEIDLSALESGLYVVRVSENGKVIATRKLTKSE